MAKNIIKFFFIIYAYQTYSTTVKLSNLVDMSGNSEVIVHGIVGEQRVEIDKYSRPITLTEIEIIDPIYYNTSKKIITIYQVGGKTSDSVFPIIGGQHYEVGQQVILFALKFNDKFVSYGLGQGKFNVSVNENTSAVVEDLGNVEEFNSKTPFLHKSPSPLHYEDLELFKKEIRSIIKYLKR